MHGNAFSQCFFIPPFCAEGLHFSAFHFLQFSLSLLALSFFGWMIFTAGFGEYNKGFTEVLPDYKPEDEPSLYAFWAGSVMGPFVHILAVAHVLLWGLPSSIVGSITIILSIMYLSAVGFPMVLGGISIYHDDDSSDDHEDAIDRGQRLLFAGGFVTTFFFACHLAFWPWFKKENDEDREDKAPIELSTF